MSKNRKLTALIIENYGTQTAFAKRLPIDGLKTDMTATVSRVINGIRPLDKDEIRQWSKLLGCSQKKLRTVLGG